MFRGQPRIRLAIAGRRVLKAPLLAVGIGAVALSCRAELGRWEAQAELPDERRDGSSGVYLGPSRYDAGDLSEQGDAGASSDGGVDTSGLSRTSEPDAGRLDRIGTDAATVESDPGARPDSSADDVNIAAASGQVVDAGEPAVMPTGAPEAGQVPAPPIWAIDVAETLERTAEESSVSVLYDAVTVDGDLSEWSKEEWLLLSHRSSMGTEASRASAEDFAATLALRWSADALYLAVMVLDDVHYNNHSGFDLWNGDSLQVAFDAGEERHPYDWEYGFALNTEGVEAHSWWPDNSEITQDMTFAVYRYDGATVYEVAFEPEHLGSAEFPQDLRLSVAVNEADGESRIEALELVEGIVGDPKSGKAFLPLQWAEP